MGVVKFIPGDGFKALNTVAGMYQKINTAITVYFTQNCLVQG